ncbi:MAG TPA: HDIG domain-containing protein [Bacteroidota bacterium]|nr:HDIG domain-containing protein [Bacteroidota bacterium]
MKWDRIRQVFARKEERDIAVRLLLGLTLLALIVIMFPHPESTEFRYSIGSVWSEKDLVAPFPFPIYKDLREYEKERSEAVRNVFPVFDRRDDIVRQNVDSLRGLLSLLKKCSASRARWLRTRAPSDSLTFGEIASRIPFTMSRADYAAWDQVEVRNGPTFEAKLEKLIEETGRSGILDAAKVKHLHNQIAVRHGNEEDIVPHDVLFTYENAVQVIAAGVAGMGNEKEAGPFLQKLVFQVVRPNIIYNEEETNGALAAAEESVPRTIGFVQENERIIGVHERITEETRLKLDSYRRMLAERGADYTEWKHWLGISLHVLLILGLYTFYLYVFRKRIFYDNVKLMILAGLILFEAFLAYLSVTISAAIPLQYFVLVPAAAMLLTIIFDSRVAFYGTVTIAFLVAGLRGNDYNYAFTSFVAGAMGAYTVRDLSNRSQIFRSLIFIFLGYAAAIFAWSLEEYESMSAISTNLTFALANAICSPLVTYAFLPVVERGFRVTTDLRLLELADVNQPLLRRLSEEAPGTFHHSITIAALAEAGAESIGANANLTRVGALYHDIGKMVKPEYFVENQLPQQNRHNRLKPRMSALIIQSHIKEGVELGRENGLPENVLDFIPQHHGTMRISFFYDKALKQAARRASKDVINEEDFRYPGPRPQSRETAIVMLADSVEASTRAMSEVTPVRLRQTIKGMIQQRFVEGQLDECELTLRDLMKIEDAFYSILVGIHHQRIVYPEQDQPAAPAPPPEPEEKAVTAAEPPDQLPADVPEADHQIVPDSPPGRTPATDAEEPAPLQEPPPADAASGEDQTTPT